MKNKYPTFFRFVSIGFILLFIFSISYTLTKNISFSQKSDTRILPSEKPMETVSLSNGDSYNLDAKPIFKNINGKNMEMLSYNGSIPGPLIKVKQNSEIIINLRNSTQFNTTLHPHGVRVENSSDGTELTQDEITPGQSHLYKLKFPDVGVFFYHPHVREDYEQNLGMYGGFIVEPQYPNYWSPVNKEETLFLNDLLLDNKGIVLYGKDFANYSLMGRYGNTFLINGKSDYNININQGDVVRFNIINTSNARPYNFAIPNVKLKLVGSDNGKYEKEELHDSIIITPSERYIVEAIFDKSGNYQISNVTPTKITKLGNITVSNVQTVKSYDKEFKILRSNEDVTEQMKIVRQHMGVNPDKTLSLFISMESMMNLPGINQGQMDSMGMMMSMEGSNNIVIKPELKKYFVNENDANNIEWEDPDITLNASSTSNLTNWQLQDQSTGDINENVNWKFNKGDKVQIRFFNIPDSGHPMQHPIHIHGQKFAILSVNNIENKNLVWKDTVDVETGATVDILVVMDNPGKWMIHCHNSEHFASNMKINFEVN